MKRFKLQITVVDNTEEKEKALTDGALGAFWVDCEYLDAAQIIEKINKIIETDVNFSEQQGWHVTGSQGFYNFKPENTEKSYDIGLIVEWKRWITSYGVAAALFLERDSERPIEVFLQLYAGEVLSKDVTELIKKDYVLFKATTGTWERYYAFRKYIVINW